MKCNDKYLVGASTEFHKQVFERLNSIASSVLEDMMQQLETIGFFEFERNNNTRTRLLSWITESNTGASSITIWAAIMKIKPHYPNVPHDRDDFIRCYDLLKLCDTTTKQNALNQIADWFDMWKPFVENWAFLEQLYEQGNYTDLRLEISKLLKHAEI